MPEGQLAVSASNGLRFAERSNTRVWKDFTPEKEAIACDKLYVIVEADAKIGGL